MVIGLVALAAAAVVARLLGWLSPWHAIAAFVSAGALFWFSTAWIVGDWRQRELQAGAATLLIAIAALIVSLGVIICVRVTTGWVWVCLALFVAALASTAWQWTRPTFIAVSLVTAFLVLDLLVGLGKYTQVQATKKLWPAQQDAALVTFDKFRPEYAALAASNDLTNPQKTLVSRAATSLDDLCRATNGATTTPKSKSTRTTSSSKPPSSSSSTTTTTPSPPSTVADCSVIAPNPQDEADLQALAEAVSRADDHMAAARDALEKTTTAGKADTSLVQTLAKAPSDDVFDLVDLGAATMVNSVRSNTLPTTTLGLNGWLVAAATALLIFRWLLVLNSQNGWGPVEVHVDDEQDDSKLSADDHLRLVTVRSYLIANVAEPAAAPGTDSLIQVSNLAAAAGFGAGPWVKAVASFVSWALAPPTGHIVRISYRQERASTDATSSASKSIITLRISTRGRSRVLETKTLAGDTEADVLRAAGYWAAGWIISHANFIPAWAKWTADCGPARRLPGRHRTGRRRRKRICGRGQAPRPREGARAEAPSSGLVLVRLAEVYQEQDRLLEALAVNLITVRAYPAYPVARYRAASVLATLAHDHGVVWHNALVADDGLAARIVELLSSEITVPDGLTTTAVGTASDSQRVDALCLTAAEEFDQASRAYLRRHMLRRALRRSERRFNFQRFGVSARVRDTYRSAILVVREIWRSNNGQAQAPGALDEGSDLESWRGQARRANAWATMLYNVACAESTRSALVPADSPTIDVLRNDAMSLLAESTTRHNGEQIKAAWVEVDPDLKPIRDDPQLLARYTRFIRSIDPRAQVNAMPRREDLIRGMWSDIQELFNNSSTDDERALRAFLNPKLVAADQSNTLAARGPETGPLRVDDGGPPPTTSFRSASLGEAIQMRCLKTISIHELVSIMNDDKDQFTEWFREVWTFEAHLLEHFLNEAGAPKATDARGVRAALRQTTPSPTHPPTPSPTPSLAPPPPPAAAAGSATGGAVVGEAVAAGAVAPAAAVAAEPGPSAAPPAIVLIAPSSATKRLGPLFADLTATQVVAPDFQHVLATTRNGDSRLDQWMPAKLAWDLAAAPDQVTLIIEEQFKLNLEPNWAVEVEGIL